MLTGGFVDPKFVDDGPVGEDDLINEEWEHCTQTLRRLLESCMRIKEIRRRRWMLIGKGWDRLI